MARSSQAAQDYRLHERLAEAYMADRIRIQVNFEHLNRAGSPVFDPWENVLPLIGLILFCIFLMVFDLVVGTIGLVVAMFVYALFVRPWVAKRVRQRTIESMLKNAHNWQVIWSLGGVVVTLVDNPRIGVVAPAGNWRTFARQFPEAGELGPGLGSRNTPPPPGSTGPSTRPPWQQED